MKYPWARGEAPDGSAKFGAYADDLPVFEWLREGAPEKRRPIEAQVMDLADDIAYSVHDVEDGVVGGWFALGTGELDRAAIHEVARDWYDAEVTDDRLDAASLRLQEMPEWPTSPLRRQPGRGCRAQEPDQRADRPLRQRRRARDQGAVGSGPTHPVRCRPRGAGRHP